ncbi:MAG TPA: hypothetical protein VFS20_24485 [Longimicrobium sp.]|nr:hypothetical protein [Longimicrobium sp.]
MTNGEMRVPDPELIQEIWDAVLDAVDRFLERGDDAGVLFTLLLAGLDGARDHFGTEGRRRMIDYLLANDEIEWLLGEIEGQQ